MWFERIKKFYDLRLWTETMVAEAVQCNKITPEQYKEITGNVYED